VKNSYYSELALFQATIQRLGVFGLANNHYSLFVFCGIAHYSTIPTKYCNNYYPKIEDSSILATILDSSKRILKEQESIR
jgi:hypothetical protein